MEPVVLIPPTGLDLRFVYDRRFPRGRFRDTITGQVVSWDTVRRTLDDTLERAGDDVQALSGRLQRREITLADWQRGMERSIKSVHLASAALEKGGFQNMTPADYGRVGRLLFNPNGAREDGSWGQYQYLRRFAGQIEQGLPLDGNFLRRADQYVQAGRQTYHRMLVLDMQEREFTETRFVLNPADHCTDKEGRRQRPPRRGCVERARAGWHTAGQWPGIGGMACHQNDRCDQEFRNPKTGQTWKPE